MKENNKIIQREDANNSAIFPSWNEADASNSLEAIYQWAVRNAKGKIAWYDRKKKPNRLRSRALRGVAVFFTAIGALCPLIDATNIFRDRLLFEYPFVLGLWGYVFLAAAAAIIGFDFYFGYSSGWMRFIVTEISIERALKEFQFDWALLKVQQQNNPAEANTPIFLQRAKDLTLQIENIVKQETDAWVSEFQTNITQLEKVLKTENEARKPGSIRVAVKNCADFERVMIRLNDNPVKELVGVTEGIINTVSPGRYEVAITGRKNGAEAKASKVVEVQAGEMVSAEFTLLV